jgi:uncharacterized membrane protein YkvA (DUF1232 family)
MWQVGENNEGGNKMRKNMRMKSTVRELFHQFEQGRWYREAKDYLSDRNKVRNLLGLVAHMFRNRALAPVLKDLILLYFYVSDIISKRYSQYNGYKLILIVAVLIYVVTPFDLIPDWIPGAGFLDDAALIGYVVKVADKELERYYLWNRKQRDVLKNQNLPIS